MFLDLEHKLFNDAVHVLDDSLSTDIGTDFLSVFSVKGPVGVDLGYVLELMVEVVVVKL